MSITKWWLFLYHFGVLGGANVDPFASVLITGRENLFPRWRHIIVGQHWLVFTLGQTCGGTLHVLDTQIACRTTTTHFGAMFRWCSFFVITTSFRWGACWHPSTTTKVLIAFVVRIWGGHLQKNESEWKLGSCAGKRWTFAPRDIHVASCDIFGATSLQLMKWGGAKSPKIYDVFFWVINFQVYHKYITKLYNISPRILVIKTIKNPQVSSPDFTVWSLQDISSWHHCLWTRACCWNIWESSCAPWPIGWSAAVEPTQIGSFCLGRWFVACDSVNWNDPLWGGCIFSGYSFFFPVWGSFPCYLLHFGATSLLCMLFVAFWS